MTELTTKQVLINQIITDLEKAGEGVDDEKLFVDIQEVHRILEKVRKLKSMEDKEIEEAEKDDSVIEDKEQ